MSVISIVLLFYTLREQQKYNYFSSFENTYKILLQSFLQKLERGDRNNSKSVFEKISDDIQNKQKQDATSTEPWKILNKVYIEIKEKYRQNRFVRDIFCTFLYMLQKIAFDEAVDYGTKKRYLHDLEYSLPNNVLAVIFLLLCSKDGSNERKVIKLLAEYEMFVELQLWNETLDDAKNRLLGYDVKKRNFLFMFIDKIRSEPYYFV